jgi:hypothetical protein
MAISAINWRPDRKRLRWFGVTAMVLLEAAAVWALLRHSLAGVEMTNETARLAAAALGGASALCGLLTLAAPAALKPLYLGLSVVGWPIGWLVSNLALALAYYAVLTPIGVVMRVWRPDPLRRRFDRDAKSYWIRRPKPDDPERYFRQF